MAALVRAYRPLAGQRDDPFGDEDLSTFFGRYLWYFHDWANDWTIGLRVGNKTQTVKIQGINQAGFTELEKQSQSEEPLHYRLLENGVGLLEFGECKAPEIIRALAEPIFTRLHNEKTLRLVVDARRNTGGGDDAWITLLEFLTSKPFRGYSGSSFRASQRLKDLLGREKFIAGYNAKAWESPPGTQIAVRYGSDDLTIPPPNPLRFTGSWCVLAGRRTFSAGMSFICAVKAYHLAKIIGEETGGRVKGFGQWVGITLPQTGLMVAVSTKQFDGAVAVPFRRGVPPDVPVPAGRRIAPNSPNDPVLKAALKQLQNTGT